MELDREAVVFGTAVEGLFKAFGDRLTPQVLHELRQIGFDATDIKAAYSLERWVDAITLVANLVASNVSEDLKFRQLGREFMIGYVGTTVGRATLAMAKIIGVKRTFMRMDRNFRTATNYIEAKSEDAGPREVRIRTGIVPKYRETLSPRAQLITPYRRGVLEETLRLVGGVGEVDLLETSNDLYQATYRIHWSN